MTEEENCSCLLANSESYLDLETMALQCIPAADDWTLVTALVRKFRYKILMKEIRYKRIKI